MNLNSSISTKHYINIENTDFSIERYNEMKQDIKLMKNNGGKLLEMPKKIQLAYWLGKSAISILKGIYSYVRK